jgi:hypothetical protein
VWQESLSGGGQIRSKGVKDDAQQMEQADGNSPESSTHLRLTKTLPARAGLKPGEQFCWALDMP